MKIRNGFVSNSSSSSFVIILPDDLDIDTLVYSNLKFLREQYARDHYDEFRGLPKGEKPKVILPYEYIDNFIKQLKAAIKKGSIYEGNYRRGEIDLFYVIPDIMNDLIISSTEAGSDGGSCSFVKMKDIQTKLDNFKKKSNDVSKDDIIKKIKQDRSEYERKKDDLKMKHIIDKDPYGEENWEEEDD